MTFLNIECLYNIIRIHDTVISTENLTLNYVFYKRKKKKEKKNKNENET